MSYGWKMRGGGGVIEIKRGEIDLLKGSAICNGIMHNKLMHYTHWFTSKGKIVHVCRYKSISFFHVVILLNVLLCCNIEY